MGYNSALEKFGKLYHQLSTIEIQNAEQCDEWIDFYRWYHDELKRYVITKNSSRILANFANQDTWTYLKLLCGVEDRLTGFSLKATDMFEMDRVPFLGRVISKENRETSMYLFANSFDYFLKQNIYNVSVDKKLISVHPISSGSSIREINMVAKTDSLGEVFIDRTFDKLYGKVVDNIWNCHKNDCSTEEVLLALRNEIIDRPATDNLTKILGEAKDAAVKMLIR